jgi:hypothetical protein
MRLGRREFLSAGATAGLLAFEVGGATLWRTARAAHEEGLPLRILSQAEAQMIEALGEILLPGAASAGLTHYLDQQLASPPTESLLMLRYLDVPPPYAQFYRAGLTALEATCQRLHGRGFAGIETAERDQIVRAMQTDRWPEWRGPPASLIYFVLRSDAVDVVYGTAEGFARLGIPYMPHIMPPTPW